MMRLAKQLCVAALPLLFACAPADDAGVADSPAVGAEATPMTPAPAMEQTVAMSAVGGSNVTGEARIAESAQQTRVTVRLTGAPASGTHPAHIHSGTCESGGPVAAPLESVTVDANGTGTSTSTVDMPMTTVMNGQHFVQAHAADGSPVACGNIPAHQM